MKLRCVECWREERAETTASVVWKGWSLCWRHYLRAEVDMMRKGSQPL